MDNGSQDATDQAYKNIDEVDAVEDFTDDQLTEEATSPVMYDPNVNHQMAGGAHTQIPPQYAAQHH